MAALQWCKHRMDVRHPSGFNHTWDCPECPAREVSHERPVVLLQVHRQQEWPVARRRPALLIVSLSAGQRYADLLATVLLVPGAGPLDPGNNVDKGFVIHPRSTRPIFGDVIGLLEALDPRDQHFG